MSGLKGLFIQNTKNISPHSLLVLSTHADILGCILGFILKCTQCGLWIIQSNQGILSLERQIAVEFLNVIYQSCEHNKQHLQALWGEGSLVPDF